MITVSLFRNVTDTVPEHFTFEWEDFLSLCQTPQVRAEKDGQLFCGAMFVPAKRDKANVQSVSVLVLDIDSNANLPEDWGFIREWGYASTVFTTHSHQRSTDAHPEPTDRFRVVFPLKEPCDKGTYERLWMWAQGRLGGICDAKARGASHMHFMPAKASEDAPYFTSAIDGDWLDWATLDLPEALPEQPVYAPQAFAPSVLNDAGARTLFDKWVGNVRGAGDGEKHDNLYRGAFVLGTLCGAGRLVESEVESALFEAVVQAGAADKRHALRTIQKSIREGAREPKYSRTLPGEEPKSVPSNSASAEVMPQGDDAYAPFVLDIGDCADQIIAYRDRSQARCDVSTGWPSLDDLYRPYKPAFTIVTGRPNHGKSEWLDNLVLNLHQNHHWKCAIISFESQPVALHQLQMVALLTGKQRHKVTDNEIRDWCKKLKGAFLFHVIPEERRTATGTLGFLEYTCDRHAIDGVIFDPFTELEQQAASKYENQTAVIGTMLNRFKGFTYRRELHFWLVIHPTKAPAEARGREADRVLTLEDGSGSANFVNKADYGITVHRVNKGMPGDFTEIWVTKVRRGMPGRLGSMGFDWQPPGRYVLRTSDNVKQKDWRVMYEE